MDTCASSLFLLSPENVFFLFSQKQKKPVIFTNHLQTYKPFAACQTNCVCTECVLMFCCLVWTYLCIRAEGPCHNVLSHTHSHTGQCVCHIYSWPSGHSSLSLPHKERSNRTCHPGCIHLMASLREREREENKHLCDYLLIVIWSTHSLTKTVCKYIMLKHDQCLLAKY